MPPPLSVATKLLLEPVVTITSEASRIDGTWSSGRVLGDMLIWNNGARTKLTEKTLTCMSIVMRGSLYTAELKEDGLLHWSDGDVWTKARMVSLGDGGDPLSVPFESSEDKH